MAYATVEDLAARWRPLSGAEATRAAVLLDDAAVRIDAAKKPSTPPADLEIRKIISCEMVKRAMFANPNQPPATQTQQTAGPFQQGITYANPTGDLYLTKAEKSLLGASRQTASTVSMLQDRPVAECPPFWDEL